MVEKTLQKIDIFISSPGDVAKERKIALEVIEQLNSMPHIADRYTLKPLAYEKIVPAAIGDTPQRTVDHYMMQADKADIFICILWSKMGTPVIDKEIAEEYQSGTEYEFTTAYQANQKSGKPAILLYRGTKSIPMDADFKQAELVKAFFKRFEGKEADFKGLYSKYRSNEDFRNILFKDLDKIISSNIVKSHVVSGAGITAGGDVTFSDIRGQVSIGENITQIVYKESVSVEKFAKRLEDREKLIKPTVFISYSHKDETWKDKFVTHLRVLQQQGLLNLWEDRHIITGEDWHQKIQEAIETAKVAILLVSADFLTSNFIQEKEVPRLLERRDKEGLWIFPVILKPCVWEEVEWLARMQVRPKDWKPLIGGDEYQIETNLVTIAKEVITIIHETSKEGGSIYAPSFEIKTDLTTKKLIQIRQWRSAQLINDHEAEVSILKLMDQYIEVKN